MIDLYYWPTPNGHKITMFLEEAGVAYAIHPVDISAGDQFKRDFLAISPNNRMPAIIDTAPADLGEPISVFEFRRHPVVPGREDRPLPAEGLARPENRDGVAVLASGRAGTDGRTEPPFRRLRAKQDSLRDRAIREGDEPSVRRPRPPSRIPHVHRRRRLQRRRHGCLSVDRSLEAPAAASGRILEPAALVRHGARSPWNAVGLRERRAVLGRPTVTEEGKNILFGQTANRAPAA